MTTKQTTEIKQVGPKVATDAIMLAMRIKRPVMLWGPPGMAKSAIVAQAAKNMNIGFIDLRLVQIESVDLRGMPYKDERDGKVVMGWAPNGLLPRTGEGILFLDELPQAPTMVQNAASELLLDRKVGEYVLPDGWGLVCAGNRRSDRAGTHEIPSHLKNRLMHMEINVDLKEWLAWASQAKVHQDVMNFLRANPRVLHQFDPDVVACPTLRTWEFASDVIRAEPTKDVRMALLAGCLGVGVALELDTFIERSKGLPQYKDIIADPANAPYPTSDSDNFALLKMVADYAQIKDIDPLLVFLRRGNREWVRMCNENILLRQPAFLENPTFKEFVDSFNAKKV